MNKEQVFWLVLIFNQTVSQDGTALTVRKHAVNIVQGTQLVTELTVTVP